jgi:hypothetical protein
MIFSLIESLRDRWANLHPLARLALLGGVAAGLGWLTVKPGYHAFKAWRVEHNLQAARTAVAESRMDDARDLSLSVLRAGEPRLEAYRILEKATAALGNPLHGEIARTLVFHPQSTDEDRLNALRSLATEDALGLLGQTWATLPPRCQLDPRFALVFADRLLAERRFRAASDILLALPGAATHTAVQQRLIRVLIGSGTTEGFTEAQRLIAAQLPAADTGDADALTPWLDLLEAIPVPSLRENLLGPLRATFQRAEGADPARLALMVARLDYAAHFERAADILQAAIARWHESAPLALANFLKDLGLYARLLDTFPPACLDAHPELFPRLLEAMEYTAAWPQLLSLLDSQPACLPKFEELAHRARAIAKSADPSARATAWAAAMADAKASSVPGAYLTLQRIASEAGMTGEAEAAMVAAIRLRRGPLPLYQNLMPLLASLERQGADSTLLEICTTYLAFEPDNPTLLTQFAYLACLSNLLDSKTILKVVQSLAAAFPKELTIRCVLATALLCDGQFAQAADTFEQLEVAPDQLPPGFYAACLTSQALAHRIPKDDPRITGFAWKSIRPCERKKFNEFLRNGVPQSPATAAPPAPGTPGNSPPAPSAGKS